MRDILVAIALLLGAVGAATGILSLVFIRKHLRGLGPVSRAPQDARPPIARDMRNAVEKMEDLPKAKGGGFGPKPNQRAGAESTRWPTSSGYPNQRSRETVQDSFPLKPEGDTQSSAPEILASIVQPASQPVARSEKIRDVPPSTSPDLPVKGRHAVEPAFSSKPLPELSSREAKQLFLEWVQREAYPANPGVIEQSAMQLLDAGELPASGTRTLSNSRKVAEFTRLGRPGATTAFVFPNPDSFFTPVIPVLFPGVAENWLTKAAAIEPLRVELVEADRWKISAGGR